VDFDLPAAITDYLAELDAFIEAEIAPLEAENIQYFDPIGTAVGCPGGSGRNC